jgi:cytochrome c
MHRYLKWGAALAIAAAANGAWAQDVQAGREVFDRHCRTCHGGTAPADFAVGPDLAGIVGARAGTRHSGVYSRATIDSGIVWDREALRRFLLKPRQEVPGSMMPDVPLEPAELESLLDYLASNR